MIKWIVSVIFVVLSITFALLKSVWSSFVFFGVGCLLVLCLYWIFIRIRQYIIDYHKNFDKAFVSYKAEIVNSNNITSEEFENMKESYVKNLKKLLRKEKFIDICKILFILAIFISGVVAIFSV